MIAVPITFREAKAYIAEHHRHHRPPQGMKVAIGCHDGQKLVGVVVLGRPVSRMLDDRSTAEVTRLCADGTRNACSFLYAAAKRCAFAMGYRRVITYILKSESGVSLKASGWRFVGAAGGGSWSRPSRSRTDKAPLEAKQLWEVTQ
jgi:hypothetical protein